MYRRTGRVLLRAARAPLAGTPTWWPDLADDTNVESWHTWLREVWSRKETAEAITLASPRLARRVGQICAGRHLQVKDVRRAVVSVVRYVLREGGRPTPFGLFAGVAWMGFGPTGKARWGQRHRPVASVDTQWLSDVVTGLEDCPELLVHLPVMVNNLRWVRGARLLLLGVARVEVRYAAAVAAVERAAGAPISFGALAAAVADQFPAARPATIRGLLTELVRLGFLVTCLRPPMTVTEPLAHLVDQLRQVGAEQVAPVAATVRALSVINADLVDHNRAEAANREQTRASVMKRMSTLAPAARTLLSVDLRLDCDLELPDQVAREMEAAAEALLRLTTQPRGPQVWRDYYAAFVQRYGIGTLVPLMQLVDPDTGLGFPATYPGSLFDPPQPMWSARDDRLHALAHLAVLDGHDEIVLNDDMIRDLAADGLDTARIPPHVELCARIHAESLAALDRGEFTLTITPARAAGTMTGRFTPDAAADPAEVFHSLPTSDADAIPAQLSFPPLYPHAENISRTARFLPHLIALGEHRALNEDSTIGLDDLAVTADRHQLRLVSASRHRPVEPQVFHALRLDKQPPTLARFLAHLPRSHTAAYTEFDWGTATRLPYLPRVRYRRSVLSPTRWQLHTTDLPDARASWSAWRSALAGWQRRWRLPEIVELRDADRTLRLDLSQSAHATLLRMQMNRAGQAVLTEADDPAGYGWLDGHAHQVAVTLISTQPAAPSPLRAGTPLVQLSYDRHGQLPASAESRWLFAKVYLHPDRQSEVIANHLPRLLADLGHDRQWWFLRYRSLHEPHHLRLRLRVSDPDDYGACTAAVGAWATQLRHLGLSRRLVLDTYYPEVGRYGDGPVLAAAETVFAADSHAVLTQLQQIPESAAHPTALAVVNLVHIACGFTGGIEPGMQWLIDHANSDRPAPATRELADQAIALADPDREFAEVRQLPGGDALAAAWARRHTALASYRQQLPAAADRDAVLSSLLHMHFIRAMGIDRDREQLCLRLARAPALRWQARNWTR